MTSSSTSSMALKGRTPNKALFHPFNNSLLKAGLGLPLCTPLTRAIRVQCSGTTRIEVVVDEEIDRIKRLQNGSDVRGVALEGEKGSTVDLTPPAVEAIDESFGEWVLSKLGDEIDEVKVSVEQINLLHERLDFTWVDMR